MADTTTFHFFPRLPPELRLMIWEAAIRPACNGVQFFSAFSNEEEPDDSPRLQLAPLPRVRQRRVSNVVTAPRVPGTQNEYSWIKGNRSTYRWDAGLWTACKESRNAIMRHLRVQYWDARRREGPRLSLTEDRELATTLVTQDDGKYWHLVLQPLKDLLCVDIQPLLDINVWAACHDWVTTLSDLPFTDPRRGFSHEVYLGMEFDPAWNAEILTNPPDHNTQTMPGAATNFVHDCWETRELDAFIWLIDQTYMYSPPAEVQERPDDDFKQVFYDLDRTRYVALTEEDLARCRQDESYPQTAVFFFDLLLDLYPKIHPDYEGDVDPLVFEIEEHVGVLVRV